MLNWIVWNLIQRLMNRKGLIRRKTKQQTNLFEMIFFSYVDSTLLKRWAVPQSATFCISYYFFFTPCEFFTPATPGGLTLEYEWQQVSSSLQDSS